MRSYLDFEKPVAELEAKVEELRAMAESGDAVAMVSVSGQFGSRALAQTGAARAAITHAMAMFTAWT